MVDYCDCRRLLVGEVGRVRPEDGLSDCSMLNFWEDINMYDASSDYWDGIFDATT